MGSVIGHSDSGCRCVRVKEIEDDRMRSYGMNVLLSVLGPGYTDPVWRCVKADASYMRGEHQRSPLHVD